MNQGLNHCGMSFSPLKFNFPSSSTSLSTNEKEKTVAINTGFASKMMPLTNSNSNSSSHQPVSQFYPSNAIKPQHTFPKPVSPTIELATTSTPKSIESTCNVNNFLYCKRNIRGQVLEFNPYNLSLNLIETVTTSGQDMLSSSVSSRALYTLKNWPSDSIPKSILCNGIGNLLAILGSIGNISVLRLSGCDVVTEEIEIESTGGAVSGIAWHPSSPADHHLAVLNRTGQLYLFDLLQAKSSFRSEYFPGSEEFENDPESNSSLDLKLLSLVDPEQNIRLPVNRTDSFAGISFLNSDGIAEVSWLPFTAFLVKESGDVMSLCPFVPLKFRAQRQSHLLPLKKLERDAMAIRWLDEVLLFCEFVASVAGDTDWVLASFPGSFTHLQPRAQGPFLIQPEPMEIHHLASYDRVVDFSVSTQIISDGAFDDSMTVLAVAFGSGKVDFMAIISEIVPKFQLNNTRTSITSNEETNFPILALLESVDLRSGVHETKSRRSVENRIKIIFTNRTGLNLVSTDDSVVRINLRISSTPSNQNQETETNFDHENEDFWSIDCESTVVIEKLKNHVHCFFDGNIYPGAIKVNFNDEIFTKPSLYNEIIDKPRGILESVTRFAFPLGKMEIEGAAVQLEGLIENLTKTLQRLKTNSISRSSSSSITNSTLPEGVDELGATEFNDRIAEWQENVVGPAMRVGHEIALRSNELVQILKREREILVRAKTLLTAKPERLQRLLIKIAETKENNRKLQDRTRKITFELGKNSTYDELLIQKLNEISDQLRENSVICGFETRTSFLNEMRTSAPDLELVHSQLLIQSEKLLKLKNKFKQTHSRK